MEYITIEVSDVELEVIPLHELPGLRVLKVLSMPPDMQRLKMSVDLLRLALRNPEDWNGIVKFFSMGDLMKVVDQWMEKSQDQANRQTEEEEERIRQLQIEEEYYNEPPEDFGMEPELDSNLFTDLEERKSHNYTAEEFFQQFLTYLEEEKENKPKDGED